MSESKSSPISQKVLFTEQLNYKQDNQSIGNVTDDKKLVGISCSEDVSSKELIDTRFDNAKLLVMFETTTVFDSSKETVVAITTIDITKRHLYIKQKPSVQSRFDLEKVFPWLFNEESQTDFTTQQDKLGIYKKYNLDFEAGGFVIDKTRKSFLTVYQRGWIYKYANSPEAVFEWDVQTGYLHLLQNSIPLSELQNILDIMYVDFNMAKKTCLMNPVLSRSVCIQEFEALQYLFYDHSLLKYVGRGTINTSIFFEYDEITQTLYFCEGSGQIGKREFTILNFLILDASNHSLLSIYALHGNQEFFSIVVDKLLNIYGIIGAMPSPQELSQLRQEVAEIVGDLKLQDSDKINLGRFTAKYTNRHLLIEFRDGSLSFSFNYITDTWSLKTCTVGVSLAKLIIGHLRNTIAQIQKKKEETKRDSEGGINQQILEQTHSKTGALSPKTRESLDQQEYEGVTFGDDNFY